MMLDWEEYLANPWYNGTGASYAFGPTIMENHQMMSQGDPLTGLSPNEIKAAIPELIRVKKLKYENSYPYGWPSTYSFPVALVEKGAESIHDAVIDIASVMKRNSSPVIIYGNIKDGSAGGHYLLASGYINCPKGICTEEMVGLFMLDSSYDSPAWPESHNIRQVALEPWRYRTKVELAENWKPTGSTFLWLRKHYYLQNSLTRG